MSEENVEVVRQALDATSGGDPNAPQAVFDPSIEWDMSGVAGWLEERVYRGEEVGDFLRAWADSWQHWTPFDSAIYSVPAVLSHGPTPSSISLSLLRSSTRSSEMLSSFLLRRQT